MTTTYTVTATTVVNRALRIQGWLDYTATVDSTKQAQMLDALNIMVKSWAKDGIKLWCYENITVTPISNQSSYTIGPSGAGTTADRPLRIWGANLSYTSQQNAPPMFAMSDKEYQELSNKSVTGAPVNYYYDAQIPNGVLYLYPTPDSYTAANCTVILRIRRTIQDIATINSNLDFPQEWYQALCWGLAAETALENQCPADVMQTIEVKAREFKMQMDNFDVEYAPIYFQYDRRGF